MKRLNPTFFILFLLFISVKFYSQSKSGITDSLAGFNFKGAMEHANEMKTDKEKALFLCIRKTTQAPLKELIIQLIRALNLQVAIILILNQGTHRDGLLPVTMLL